MYNAAPPTRRTALTIGALAHVVQDGLIAAIYVILPVLAQGFGLSYAQIGLLKGLKSGVQAALELGSGWLSEAMGEARLIVLGLVLSGLGYAALSAAPGIGLLAACLTMIGAGTALHHAPSSALIARAYAGGGRGAALGLYNASGDVGKLAFTGLFSLVTGMGLAWQQISLVYGGMALLCALAVLRLALRLAGPPAAAPSGSGQGRPRLQGWGIRDRRAFGAIVLISSLDTLVQTGVLVFVAFLMLEKGLALPLATAATVILLAGGDFGKAGCGHLADRIGARRGFALMQGATAAGLVAIALLPAGPALILLAPLGAVLQGTSSITYGAAAGVVDPARAARSYALLYSAGTLAAALGPFAIGHIADGQGIGAAFLVMALAAGLSVPPAALLPRDRAGEAPPG